MLFERPVAWRIRSSPTGRPCATDRIRPCFATAWLGRSWRMATTKIWRSAALLRDVVRCRRPTQGPGALCRDSGGPARPRGAVGYGAGRAGRDRPRPQGRRALLAACGAVHQADDPNWYRLQDLSRCGRGDGGAAAPPGAEGLVTGAGSRSDLKPGAISRAPGAVPVFRSFVAAALTLTAGSLQLPHAAHAADQGLPVPEIEKIVSQYLDRRPR